MTLMSLYRPQTPREMALWTVRIYARHWTLWIVLAAIAILPVQALSLAAAPAQTAMLDLESMNELVQSLQDGTLPDEAALEALQALAGPMVGVFLLTLGLGLVALLMQAVILGGAGAVMASRAYRGEDVSLGQALTVALGERLVPLLGGHLAVSVVIAGLLIASALTVLMCVGVLGLGVTAFVYLAWFPLLAPLLVLERGPLNILLQRAWYFGKKRVFQLFGAVVVFLVLRFVALTAAGLLASILGLLLPESVTLLAEVVFGAVALVLVAPPEAIFYTLMLYDARQRLAAESAGGEALSMVEPAGLAGPDTVVRPPPEPFLTAADLPNLVTVTLMTLGLVFVLFLLLPLFGL